MALPRGARLGPYEVAGPLGAGGKGEVYRARDTRLGREVALKVLPEDLSSDRQRLARFQQEARAAAAREDVAIVRLEQLYPFPGGELKEAFARFPNLRDVRWVQEEPANMGGWRAMRHRLEGVLPAGVTLARVSRPSASSPATGYYGMHQQQEQQLLAEAFRAAEPRPPARPERGERSSRGVKP